MKLTEVKTFFIAEKKLAAPHVLKFMNRLGSWDTMQLTRYRSTNIKTTANTFDCDDVEKISSIDSRKTYTYYTQDMVAGNFDWLTDLMLSPVVLIDNSYVKLTDSPYQIDGLDDLIQFELTVTPLREEIGIKL